MTLYLSHYIPVIFIICIVPTSFISLLHFMNWSHFLYCLPPLFWHSTTHTLKWLSMSHLLQVFSYARHCLGDVVTFHSTYIPMSSAFGNSVLTCVPLFLLYTMFCLSCPIFIALMLFILAFYDFWYFYPLCQ